MRSVGIQTHGRSIVGGAGTNGSNSKWIHLIIWPKFCKMFWGPKCLLTRYNVDSQNDSNFVSFCVEVKMCRKPQILLHYFYWKQIINWCITYYLKNYNWGSLMLCRLPNNKSKLLSQPATYPTQLTQVGRYNIVDVGRQVGTTQLTQVGRYNIVDVDRQVGTAQLTQVGRYNGS